MTDGRYIPPPIETGAWQEKVADAPEEAVPVPLDPMTPEDQVPGVVA